MDIITFKEFRDKLNEVSYEPVLINWFYRKSGDWYGDFSVDYKDYDIAIKREGTDKTNLNIVSIKFARPDLKDPHSFAADFNKPMVVANTVSVALKEYIQREPINVLIFKSYKKETSRVTKYRLVSRLLTSAGFTFTEEIEKGDYMYFILFRSSKDFKDEGIRNYIESL